MPIIIIVTPPIVVMVMTVIMVIPIVVMISMACIPIPSIYPIVVVWIVVKVIVGSWIYIYGVSIVIHKPVVYTAIIPQVPIEAARQQSTR
jgi:hypothetical protein